MSRRPPDRREVMPSREAMGNRSGPSFGTRTNVSVPISFGLPLIVVGIALLAAAISTGRGLYWALGGAALLGGVGLFASGKRL